MKYFIGILAILALIILGVILFGGHGGKKPVKPIVSVKTLPEFASTSAQTRLTVDGIINGDDVHRQIRITIGQSQRTIDIIQGYQGNVIKSESFPNNQNAYQAFLQAIDYEGFTGTRKSSLTSDQGVCPLGNRYIYEFIGSDGSDFRHWSTSCGTQGTFAGQGGSIRVLFHNQITDYDQFVGGVNLL